MVQIDGTPTTAREQHGFTTRACPHLLSARHAELAWARLTVAWHRVWLWAEVGLC